MSDVASKELSERLYKVSNWKDTEWWFFEDKPVYIQIEKVIADLKLTIPTYTAGYLLRRLPKIHKFEKLKLIPILEWDHELKVWRAMYIDDTSSYAQYAKVDTEPENALCKLAIELFRLGILKREDK